jgi:hypothetical protein
LDNFLIYDFIMASSGSLFSDTLNNITTTKLEELSKKNAQFEQRYSSLLTNVELEEEPLQRLIILIDEIKTKSFSVENLGTLERFLEQARFDPAITPKLIREWEEKLLKQLSVQSLRLKYATLYGQLVTEWLSSEKKLDVGREDVEMNEGFEEVPTGKRLEARAAWERGTSRMISLNELYPFCGQGIR